MTEVVKDGRKGFGCAQCHAAFPVAKPKAAKEKASAQDGVCCGCGYAGEEEMPCAGREDGTHCVHWWDGDGTVCDHGSPSCAKCRAEAQA
jgi:hypothetical protein